MISNRIKRKIDKQAEDIAALLVDVDRIRIKWDASSKKGYYISIIQKDKEASDVIDYFYEKFNRKSDSRLQFLGFALLNDKGKEVTMVRFFYYLNLFEKSLHGVSK